VGRLLMGEETRQNGAGPGARPRGFARPAPPQFRSYRRYNRDAGCAAGRVRTARRRMETHLTR